MGHRFGVSLVPTVSQSKSTSLLHFFNFLVGNPTTSLLRCLLFPLPTVNLGSPVWSDGPGDFGCGDPRELLLGPFGRGDAALPRTARAPGKGWGVGSFGQITHHAMPLSISAVYFVQLADGNHWVCAKIQWMAKSIQRTTVQKAWENDCPVNTNKQ